MSLKKRRLTGCLLIILLLIFIEGCGTKRPIAFVKQQSLKNIILTDDVWGRVIIDDKVTLSNIEFFLSKLQPSKLKPSNLLLESAIKAQLFFQDNGKEMYFTEEWAYDGKKVYEGKDTNAIFAILKKDLYSKRQLGEMIQNSPVVTLSAKDINKSFQVANKSTLAQAILTSSQVNGELEQVVQLPPEYPFYQINISLSNSKRVVVTVLSPDFFVVNDLEKLHVFSNGKKLWEYFVANLGKPVLRPDQIAYLFQADNIQSSKWGGDLLPKKMFIVRVLTDGKLLNKKPVNLKENNELTFKINGKKFKVQVYDNYFFYKGRIYSLPGVMENLEKVVSAG